MKENHRPLGRKSNVVVQELEDEVLIYNLDNNKAFCLNETSALIWELCDGKNTTRGISEKMTKKLKQSVSEEYIWLALNQLKKEDLIEENDAIEDKYQGLSRREVIRKIGYGSMIALPIVSSIVAPTAVSAQSGGLPLGVSCTDDPQCASGNCNPLFNPFGPVVCCDSGTGNIAPNIVPSGTPCSDSQAEADSFCCSGIAGPIAPAPSCPPQNPFVGICQPYP